MIAHYLEFVYNISTKRRTDLNRQTALSAELFVRLRIFLQNTLCIRKSRRRDKKSASRDDRRFAENRRHNYKISELIWEKQKNY